jgi:hydroxymethylglutaryl-CoA lyase
MDSRAGARERKVAEKFNLIECPRDAWQGLPAFIPTEEKAAYHRALIGAGFRHIDAVSFVSPKHVMQMADSEEVMRLLQESFPSPPSLPSPPPLPEIIGIVVNERGMERALATPGVSTLGYPYSVSAHFRRANANMSRDESRSLVEKMQKETARAGRGLVVYISMAFGNNYGEPWGPEIDEQAIVWLRDAGVKCVSLADTIGTASPELVGHVYRSVRDAAEGIELGVHLHSRRESAAEKVLAAYEAGCRRFDCALTGLGGCPFAGDDLVGNIPTETVVETLARRGISAGLELAKLEPAMALSRQIARKYGPAVTVH